MATPKMPELNEGGQRTLDSLTHLIGAHGERLDGHDGRLDDHSAMLGEHGDRLAALEKANDIGDSRDGND